MNLRSRISRVVSGVVLGVFLSTSFTIGAGLDYPRIDPQQRTLTNIIPNCGDYGTARLTLSVVPTPQGVLASERAVIHSLDGLKPDRVIIMDFLSIDSEKGLVRMMLRIDGRPNKIVFDSAKGRFAQWSGPDS